MSLLTKWVCKVCGFHNRDTDDCCWNCGFLQGCD